MATQQLSKEIMKLKKTFIGKKALSHIVQKLHNNCTTQMWEKLQTILEKTYLTLKNKTAVGISYGIGSNPCRN